MRKELSKLYFKEKYNKVESYEFIAFFEKRGTDRKKIDGKYVIRKRNAKILLKNITFNGRIICEHVWVDGIAFKGLEKNHKYSFNANIEKYYKRGGIKDYSLMNISNIHLIEE